MGEACTSADRKKKGGEGEQTTRQGDFDRKSSWRPRTAVMQWPAALARPSAMGRLLLILSLL